MEKKAGSYVVIEGSLRGRPEQYIIEMRAVVRDGQVKEAILSSISLRSQTFSIAPFFWEEGGIDKLIAFLKAVQAEED